MSLTNTRRLYGLRLTAFDGIAYLSQGGGSGLSSQNQQQVHHIRLHRRVGSEGLEREPLIAKGAASSSYQPESNANDILYTKNTAIKSPTHKVLSTKKKVCLFVDSCSVITEFCGKRSF